MALQFLDPEPSGKKDKLTFIDPPIETDIITSDKEEENLTFIDPPVEQAHLKFIDPEPSQDSDKPSFWSKPLAPRGLIDALLFPTPVGMAAKVSGSPLVRGAAEGIKDVAQGLTTPTNIGLMAGTTAASLVGGPIGAAVTRGAGLGFGLGMAKDTAESAGEAYDLLKKGEIEEGVRRGTGAAASGLFATLGLKTAFGKAKPIEAKVESLKKTIVPKKSEITPFTKLREVVQDRMIRAKKLEEQPGVIKEGLSPYESEILFHGKVGRRLEEVMDTANSIEIDIVNSSKKYGGVDLTAEVDLFLQAKHAPERNVVHGDGAAGMTNRQASSELARIESAPYVSEVTRIGRKISDLNQQTLDVLLDGEVISKDVYARLNKTYPNHVPLQRILETTEDVGAFLASKGMDVKSTGLMRAKGSDLKVADITSNVVANLESAIVRAEKNKVDLSLLTFARNNPQLGIFEVSKPKAIGLSFEGKPILAKVSDPQTLVLREKGKPVNIKIKDPHLATAYRGLNVENIPTLLGFIQKFTRLYSSLATRFNPEFFLPNKIRDIQEMAVYVSSVPEMGVKGAAKSAIKDPLSIKSVMEFVLGKDTDGSRLYRQMARDGGTTGGMGMSTREQIAVDMNKIRKINRSSPRKAVSELIKGVDHINRVFEDSTRLSVYSQALAQGMTREKAALLAKESTINFNRKGTGGPIINALYMFSNASIQGSAKILKAMKNPKVATSVIASVGASAIFANQWNDNIDPDWRDKVSHYDRASSLIFVIPSDEGIKYITVPVSWGIKPIKVMADYAYDLSIGDSPSLKNVAGAIIEGYNPLGGTDLGSAIMPTIGDIPFEIARNKAWYGGIIRPEYDAKAPASEKYFKSFGKTIPEQIALKGTRALSKIGIEVSPANVVYAYNQIISGPGRFLSKSFSTLASLAKDEKPHIRDVPFVSRFLKGKTGEELVRENFFLSGKKSNANKEKPFIKEVDRISDSIGKKIKFTNWGTTSNFKINQFREKVGDSVFKEATELYNERLRLKLLSGISMSSYRHMDDEGKYKWLIKQDNDARDYVFFKYKFRYKKELK